MRAELISIGDELLLGQTINTNATWIGEQLAKIGVQLYQVSTITDEGEHILNALQDGADRADLIFITGGLGPTKDDITKEVLCRYFNTELEMNEEVLAWIAETFSKLGLEKLEVNRQQAALPKTARVVRNYKGTASGMWFEREGKVFVSMPGVPYEMKAMMENEILPALQEKFSSTALQYRTILRQGIGESYLAERIKDWEDRLRSEGLGLAYLPSPGIVKLRVSASKEYERHLSGYVEELYGLIPELIYGEGAVKLENVVGELLLKAGSTLATAESCTGGAISSSITSVPGSSSYFKGAIVSYSNSAKNTELGVSEETLKESGAVSEPVALQMADGTAKAFQSDYALSTTGIAGPDGGTKEKPVGTVWIGVKTPGGTTARLYHFFGQRQHIVDRTVKTALNMLRKAILKENSW